MLMKAIADAARVDARGRMRYLRKCWGTRPLPLNVKAFPMRHALYLVCASDVKRLCTCGVNSTSHRFMLHTKCGLAVTRQRCDTLEEITLGSSERTICVTTEVKLFSLRSQFLCCRLDSHTRNTST